MTDFGALEGVRARQSVTVNPRRAVRVLMVQTQAENAGAQEISRLLGRDLEQRGYDVHHLFFYRRTAGADRLAKVVHCADARPSGIAGMLRLFTRIAREIRRIRPDVVLTFQHYGNIVGAPIARFVSAAPVIANQVSAEGVTNRLIRAADRLLGNLGFFDAVTVNSDDTAKAFAAHPARYRDRIISVPHGFEDKSAGIGKAEARARLGLPGNLPLIGCAARLHAMKRLDDAVRLLALRPTWTLALAGQGPEHAALASLAADLGVTDRVHFLGELDPDGMRIFLASLDAFVFPSAAETFGLAAVEAAQAGVPVVANGLPVLREVLQSDHGPAAVFVASEDTEAFAAAVDGVLDPTQAAAIVRSGRQLSGRYSLSAMVDAYEALITRVMTRGA